MNMVINFINHSDAGGLFMKLMWYKKLITYLPIDGKVKKRNDEYGMILNFDVGTYLFLLKTNYH